MSEEQRPLLSSMPQVYAIRNWSELFETAESRKRAAPLEWIRKPTHRDGRGYMRIMAQRNRQTVYLGWCLLLEEAGKMPCRGVFAHLGGPLDAVDLAEKTRLREANVFRVALTELTKPEIGWIEQLEWRADLGFWENIEQLGLTPPYLARRRTDSAHGGTEQDTAGRGKQQAPPRSAARNGTRQHNPAHDGTEQETAGRNGVQEKRLEDSTRENLSFSPDRELSQPELISLLVDLTKKAFAGAPLAPADFQNREKDLWLQQAMPITFAGFDALAWFYGLPLNHEVFRTTARVQSAEQLLRKLKNEVGKALTIRSQSGDPPPALKKEPEPDGWQSFFRDKYGPDCRLPASFWELGTDQRAEWDREHKEIGQ